MPCPYGGIAHAAHFGAMRYAYCARGLFGVP